MDRIEVIRCWDESRNQSAVKSMPRWLHWRVTKKLAKWTRHPRRCETRLFWGQGMTIVYPEYVSSKIGRHGYFETDMTSMLIDVLRPDMVVYDVGSHFGYFSLLASELIGPQGHVYAFEPTANTFNVLTENASRRQNITCSNIAAFRESGEIAFWDRGLHDSALNFVVNEDQRTDTEASRGQVLKVPAVKLDDFAAQNRDPDFIKIDAEGAEGPILEGMSAIIARSRPGISLEMGDHVCERTGNKPCRENVEFLRDHGYEVYDYRNCIPQRHETLSTYNYDNLFFRHPNWRWEETRASAA